MNDEPDRPTPPQTPKPSDPPAPAPRSDVWLPPRLRDRLESASAPEPKASPLGPILGVVTLLIVGGLVWWMVQTNQAKAKAAAHAAQVAAAAAAAATADSLQRIHTADSLVAVARADSITAFLKLPKWKQNKILGIVTPGEPDLEEKGSFVLDAGSFLFEEPANKAMAAIQGSSKLAVRVVPVTDGGNTSYHVYVGHFATRGAAQGAADNLLTKGLVNQANVVLEPKAK